MPGRFGRLEFEQNAKAEVRPQEAVYGEAIRDAAHLFAEAQEARMWGDHERALRLFTRSLTDDRSHVAAWVGQVQMLVQLKEFSEARLWADKALEVFPRHGDLWAAKAQACARLRDRPAAIACSDGSLSCPGASAWRWIARGEVLLTLKRGHHQDCFDRAAAEADFVWFDHLLIAEVFTWHRHAAAALKSAQAATAAQPGHGYAWFVLGRCQEKLGWAAHAAQSYARCLELAPRFAPALAARDTLARSTFLTRLLRRLTPRLR